MNDDLYDRWRARRGNADPPADFADRVMNAVRREPVRRGLGRLLASPVVRVAAGVLACAVCLYRMASVIAVFFTQ